MFGIQPEFDLGEGDTIYGAICYDRLRRPLADIIRPTYFDGLDLVPGNLELMEFEYETPRALAESKHGGGNTFFKRVGAALSDVEERYDVVIVDCPPQLGYLTLGAVCAATSLLITVHPQMVDVASMSQFLLMAGDLLAVVRRAGGDLNHDFIRYVITRHEPHDGPQSQIVALLRSLFGEEVLAASVWKSTAIADAGLTKQSLYELERGSVGRATFDRAIESLEAVNGEILGLIHKAWGRGDEVGGSESRTSTRRRRTARSWPWPTLLSRRPAGGKNVFRQGRSAQWDWRSIGSNKKAVIFNRRLLLGRQLSSLTRSWSTRRSSATAFRGRTLALRPSNSPLPIAGRKSRSLCDRIRQKMGDIRSLMVTAAFERPMSLDERFALLSANCQISSWWSRKVSRTPSERTSPN